MTPDQIRVAITASPVLLALVPDTQAIASALSVGRMRPNDREIGNGSVLETIGITAGNALLDAIAGTPSYRYVKPLLDQGRLKAGSPLITAALGPLVTAGVITQPQAAALLALGQEPNPVDEFAVRVAIYADDGSRKV